MTGELHEETQLLSGLLVRIAAATGASAKRAERVPGGGRREAWSVGVGMDESPEPMFPAFNPDEDRPRTPFTRHREAHFLRALLGEPVDDLPQARRAAAEVAATRAVPDRDLLTCFVRQAGRDCQLVESAAGSMAARHFEPLPTALGRR